MNRLLSKAADPYFVTNHIGAASEGFTYTATGKRATMTDQSGTTTYGYDTRDRLQTEATPEGTLSYTYDAAGDVKTIASSNTNGASMAYGYDALDRLASVTDANGATTYAYDNVGNLQSFTYPNGVVHGYTYDTRNRLTNLGVKNATTSLESYGYTLDAAGHRTAVTELSGRTVNYGYDTIYRLTNETVASDPNGMNGVVSYSYDAVGNRLQKSSTVPGMPGGGGSSTYNANDELTTDQYDADGNTIGSGTNTGTSGYVYDFENRLVQQGGIGIVYDGDGNRVSKTTANGTTQYLVDDLNPTGYAQVMDEVQSSAVARTYTWGLDLISEHQTLNSTLTTSYYVFDGHGSVRALTNASGAITDTYDYDAFGILTHSSGTTPNNYLFAGEQFDPDLGLYYNRARYLSANTARFWTMDTHEGDDEDPTTLHKYLYAGSDPVDRDDQSGNEFDVGSISFDASIGSVLDSMPTLSSREYLVGGSEEPRIATDQSDRGEDFLKCHEGDPAACGPLLKPYDKDGSKTGNCTVGWGHKIRGGACKPIDYVTYKNFDESAAEDLLFTDVQDIALAPIKRLINVGLAQRELDALIDFTFNLGGANLEVSVLRQQINAKDYKNAGNGFLGWLRPPTIRGRRMDEKNLWEKGDYTSNGHPN